MQLDEEPHDFEMYGHDPYAPSSVESDNDVIVEAVYLPHDDLLTSFVLETIDPLQQTDEMGIDIDIKALELVISKIDELANS